MNADDVARLALHAVAREGDELLLRIGMRDELGDAAAQIRRARSEPPLMDVKHVGDAVLHMANLPLDVNVQFMTIMATKMPFVGRG